MFVDNYLDGGYHVPYLHEGLGSVLDYHKYTIENGRRHCLQSSPMVTRGAEEATGAVRKGERALYYWFYPNFMFNWYEGVMDTNLVYPRGVDQTEVIFDFWFADVSRGRARLQPRLDRHRQPRAGRGRGHLPVRAARPAVRAPTTPAACRCGARRASSCSTSCCTPT